MDKIKNGFENFFQDYGRYPTAIDVDRYDLLPSSRQIQRKFGGLVNLRRTLGLPLDFLDFTRGEIRSETSKEISARGISFEKSIYNILVNKFGEICVHEQKPFGQYENKSRLDFFVYCKDFNFGVDVFFARDIHSLRGCVNIKERSYQNINFDLIFLSANQAIAQQMINTFVDNKLNKLNSRIKIFSFESFTKFLENLKPLTF